MVQKRIIRKFCKLKNREVKFLEEKIYELGREDSIGKDQKCLDRDKSCEEIGCKYALSGIGNVKNKDLF